MRKTTKAMALITAASIDVYKRQPQIWDFFFSKEPDHDSGSCKRSECSI